MTFVDTNYFLRFLLADQTKQHYQARQLFLEAAEGKRKLFTSGVVIFEIYWVLTSFYRKERREVGRVLAKILGLDFLKVENRDVLEKAVQIYKSSNLDLEDSYNLAFAKINKMKEFKTFDKRLLKFFP